MFDCGGFTTSGTDAAVLQQHRNRRRGPSGGGPARYTREGRGGGGGLDGVAEGVERPRQPVQVTAAAAAGVRPVLEAEGRRNGADEHARGRECDAGATEGAAWRAGGLRRSVGLQSVCGRRPPIWQQHGRGSETAEHGDGRLMACCRRWSGRGGRTRSIPPGSAEISGSLPWSCDSVSGAQGVAGVYCRCTCTGTAAILCD